MILTVACYSFDFQSLFLITKLPIPMKYAFTIIISCISFFAIAQAENAERRRNFNTENYVAMREWDPVSYFQGKPAKGNSKFSAEYKAITYYFASAANRDE